MCKWEYSSLPNIWIIVLNDSMILEQENVAVLERYYFLQT